MKLRLTLVLLIAIVVTGSSAPAFPIMPNSGLPAAENSNKKPKNATKPKNAGNTNKGTPAVKTKTTTTNSNKETSAAAKRKADQEGNVNKRTQKAKTATTNANRKPATEPAKPKTEAPPSAAPTGATAECNDGTFSKSASHRGACARHGGVKRWLK